MNEDLLQQIMNFVESQLWTPKGGLTKTTRLRQDIGIAGEEAAEFMGAFSEEFGVNMSNFEFDQYFEREANALLIPLGLLQILFGAVFNRKKLTASHVIPITIEDLARAAQEKKWIPPEESRKDFSESQREGFRATAKT